ncbi:hypothetical protein HZA73_08065 [candidate division TA06 bacterium]|nr:hypothetical protein [candidate division TA06 bacterium]
MGRVILLAMVLTVQSWAQQWSPAVNLMLSDPGSSWTASNQARSLAVQGDTVHLVWFNSTEVLANMGHQIYYKKYNGALWDTSNTLIGYMGNYRRHSWYPSCAMGPGGDLHVVWETNDFVQTSDGASIYDIAYRQLSHGIWTPSLSENPIKVTGNVSQGYSWRPVIACGLDNIAHIAWQDNRQGTFKIFYRSLTNGSAWSDYLCLSPQGVYAGFPSIALSGTQPAVVWQDFRNGSNQIYFAQKTMSGWGQDSSISQSNFGAFAPCLAGDQAGNLHVAWEDLRDGNFEIYYRRFNAQTQLWGNVLRLTKDPFYSRQPFLLCQDDSTVSLFWSDDRNGSYEIYHRQSVNNIWQPETTITTFNGSASLNPSAAMDHLGNLHLVWSDFGVPYLAPDIFYMTGVYAKIATSENQPPVPGSAVLAMLPARPNPLRDRTKISMTTAQSGWARVSVYNIAGQLVKEIYRGQLAGGQHEFEWDARDGKGDRVSNGLYLTRAESSGAAVTGKIMVVR